MNLKELTPTFIWAVKPNELEHQLRTIIDAYLYRKNTYQHRTDVIGVLTRIQRDLD